MKGFVATAASVLSLSTAALATVSKPFYLTLKSSNATLNGVKLGECHEGAAIESLCVYKDDTTTFRFNTTNSGNPKHGTLVWNLQIGTGTGSQIVPSALEFSGTYLSTNVQHPQFFPGPEGVFVGFDSANRLYIPQNYNDAVTPPTGEKEFNLYNWYVCQTYAGYLYTTLNWVSGQGNVTPTNPSCQKVDVIRQFKK